MIPLHPVNEFSPEFISAFKRKVYAKRAVGMNQLEGKVFEQFWCEMYGLKWKGSNKGIDDLVVGGKVGISVKSLTIDCRSPYYQDGSLRSARIVIGRASPDTADGSHIEKYVTPPEEAGKKVVEIYNDRLRKSLAKCTEIRQFAALKSEDLSYFILYEQTPVEYDHKSFVWTWGEKVERTNLYGTDGERELTWQPNGSQLTLSQRIPEKHAIITLRRDIPIITEESILSQVGFDDSWIDFDFDPKPKPKPPRKSTKRPKRRQVLQVVELELEQC